MEFSWHSELYDDKFDLLPDVRDQGRTNTCVFQALSGASEMEQKKNAALRGKHCTKRILTESFISEYEKEKGKIPGDSTRKTRLKTALEMFRKEGVLSQDGDKIEKLKLRGFQTQDHLNFKGIAGIISDGKPVIGSFKIDDCFAELMPNEIYKYDVKQSKKTDNGHQCTHAVIFIGYGLEEDNSPYLVFLNSYGTGWCERGIGRVSFADVSNLITIDV